MGGLCRMHRGYEKSIQNFSRKTNGKYIMRDSHREGRIILKWIIKMQGVRLWTGFTWLRIWSSKSKVASVL
jgi:hypothetical protein